MNTLIVDYLNTIRACSCSSFLFACPKRNKKDPENQYTAWFSVYTLINFSTTVVNSYCAFTIILHAKSIIGHDLFGFIAVIKVL